MIVGPGLPPGAALPHHRCSADPLIVYYFPTGELLNVRLAQPLLLALLSPGIISHCQLQQPSHQTLLLAQNTVHCIVHISLNESKCHLLFIFHVVSSIHNKRLWGQNISQNSNLLTSQRKTKPGWIRYVQIEKILVLPSLSKILLIHTHTHNVQALNSANSSD